MYSTYKLTTYMLRIHLWLYMYGMHSTAVCFRSFDLWARMISDKMDLNSVHVPAEDLIYVSGVVKAGCGLNWI